jgi:hypothetical protein
MGVRRKPDREGGRRSCYFGSSPIFCGRRLKGPSEAPRRADSVYRRSQPERQGCPRRSAAPAGLDPRVGTRSQYNSDGGNSGRSEGNRGADRQPRRGEAPGSGLRYSLYERQRPLSEILGIEALAPSGRDPRPCGRLVRAVALPGTWPALPRLRPPAASLAVSGHLPVPDHPTEAPLFLARQESVRPPSRSGFRSCRIAKLPPVEMRVERSRRYGTHRSPIDRQGEQ